MRTAYNRIGALLVATVVSYAAVSFAEDFGGYKGVKQGGTFTNDVTLSAGKKIIFGDGSSMDAVSSGPVKATLGSDLIASRAQNVVYQNTSGKLMWLHISIYLTGSAGCSHQLYVGTANPPTTEVMRVSETSIGYAKEISFPIPPNNYYKLGTDCGGGYVLQQWYEILVDGGGTGSESKMVEVVNELIGTSRNVGTIYQNGPNWRFVNVRDCVNSGGQYLTLSSGATSSLTPSFDISGTVASQQWQTVSGWIQPGYYYRVSASSGPCAGSEVYRHWAEQDLTVVGSNPAYAYASGAAQSFTGSSTWTSVSFNAVAVSKGVTVSGTSISFARKGVYRISLGFRSASTDDWTAVRLWNGSSTVAVSNGFGTGTGSTMSPEMLADITDTALTYNLQVGRNSAAGTTDNPVTIGGTASPSVTLTIQSVDSSTDGTAGNIVAWGKFSTGVTPVKDAGSSNISISRVSAGQYDITFSPSLADANYSITAMCKGGAASWGCGTQEAHDATRSASTVRLYTFKDTDSVPGDIGSLADFTILNVQVVR